VVTGEVALTEVANDLPDPVVDLLEVVMQLGTRAAIPVVAIGRRRRAGPDGRRRAPSPRHRRRAGARCRGCCARGVRRAPLTTRPRRPTSRTPPTTRCSRRSGRGETGSSGPRTCRP